MNDTEMLMMPMFQRVVVNAGDYSYEGWLVSFFRKKKSAQLRCVVEDDQGRLFIHSAGQLTDKG